MDNVIVEQYNADYNPVKSFIYFFYAAPCFRA